MFEMLVLSELVDRLVMAVRFNPTRETWSVPGLADEFLAEGSLSWSA